MLWSYCNLDFTFVSVGTIEKPTDIPTLQEPAWSDIMMIIELRDGGSTAETKLTLDHQTLNLTMGKSLLCRHGGFKAFHDDIKSWWNNREQMTRD